MKNQNDFDKPCVLATNAPASTAKAAPIVAPDDRWSRPKMAEFLRVLAATQNVSRAARAVGLSRQSAYKLRARLKGTPFDVAWETAFQHGFDNLAHFALERAMEGQEVPHYYRGELVGTTRHYNDRLLLFLLKERNYAGRSSLGRFGAAREYYSEEWDRLLERVEHGPLDFADDRVDAVAGDGVAEGGSAGGEGALPADPNSANPEIAAPKISSPKFATPSMDSAKTDDPGKPALGEVEALRRSNLPDKFADREFNAERDRQQAAKRAGKHRW